MLLRHARAAPLRELDYGPAGGSIALREAIAVHLRRSRAVVCEPSQVIVVSGSQQALDLIARVLIERGDRIVLEDPCYQGTREVLRAAGLDRSPFPVDEQGIDPQSCRRHGWPSSHHRISFRPAPFCRCRGDWRWSTGRSAATQSSSRTITTGSFATRISCPVAAGAGCRGARHLHRHVLAHRLLLVAHRLSGRAQIAGLGVHVCQVAVRPPHGNAGAGALAEFISSGLYERHRGACAVVTRHVALHCSEPSATICRIGPW